MTDRQSTPNAEQARHAADQAMPLKVFINYRRDDAEEAALRLYDKLAAELGAENVFLDLKTMEPGSKWLAQTTGWLEDSKNRDSCRGVFLALIGRTWLAELKERQRATPSPPADIVALELEHALSEWPGKVLPILVGRTLMPSASSLPRPLRGLAAIQSISLRPQSFEQDVEQLLAELHAIGPEREGLGVSPTGTPIVDVANRASIGAEDRDNRASSEEADSRPSGADGDSQPAVHAVPGPDAAHYEGVVRRIENGSVVPVLGSRVRGSLPDADQLATRLSQKLGLSTESRDLAAVAQLAVVTEGPSFLARTISQMLRPEPEPSLTHRFLAQLPARLKQRGCADRFQMIVTTNYDSSLEHAFDAEDAQYDLAVFLANGTNSRGDDKGKFLHVPWEGEPQVVNDTTTYRGFPIGPEDELERTVIVKIQGAAQGGEGDHRWDGNSLLTEDQYIDYLVADEMIRVIPSQILNKLTASHCLFLGYAMQDWSLRVFLKRVWRGGQLENRSWAIERAPDVLERDWWQSFKVELLGCSPDDYVKALDARLAPPPADGS